MMLKNRKEEEVFLILSPCFYIEKGQHPPEIWTRDLWSTAVLQLLSRLNEPKNTSLMWIKGSNYLLKTKDMQVSTPRVKGHNLSAADNSDKSR